MEKKTIDYTIFDKETIENQFNEIASLSSDISHSELIHRIQNILFNRPIFTRIFEKGFELTLYRITSEYEGFDPEKKKSYTHPEFQKRNRANIEGFSVMYASMDMLSAIAEMKEHLKVGQKFYISKWRLYCTKQIVVHDLIVNTSTVMGNSIVSNVAKSQNEAYKSMVKNIPEKFQDGFLYQIEKLGNLFTEPGEKLYHITSAYAHQILYSLKQQGADISMIMYPTVENFHRSINVAIHPALVNSDCISLVEVYESELQLKKINSDNSLVRSTISKKGIFSDEKFSHWEVISIKQTRIGFRDLKITTYNNHWLNGIRASSVFINDNQSIMVWLKNEINEKLQGDLSKYLIYDEREVDPFAAMIENDYEMTIEYDHGHEIVTPEGKSCIRKIEVPVRIKREFIRAN